MPELGRERLGVAGPGPGEGDAEDVISPGLGDQQERLVAGDCHSVRKVQAVGDEVEARTGRPIAEDAAVGPVLEQVVFVVLNAVLRRAVGEVDTAVRRDGGVVGELEPPAAMGVRQHPDVTGFVHPQQSPVGVADNEAVVARVGLQAQGAAVGVGEQLGRARVGELTGEGQIRPSSTPTYNRRRHRRRRLRFGPAGHLPPLNLVKQLVGCQHALKG